MTQLQVKMLWLLCSDFYNNHCVTFEIILYLEAVFASPPARVLFWRHVYDGHNVPHLRSRETDGENKVDSNSKRRGDYKYDVSYIFPWRKGYLKGQLVCGLGRVALGDMGSSDGRNVDGGLLRHQQMVPFVVNLETQNSNISKYLAFKNFFFFYLDFLSDLVKTGETRKTPQVILQWNRGKHWTVLPFFAHGSNQLCYGFINVITQVFFEFCCRRVSHILQPNYNSLVIKFVFSRKGGITNLKHDYQGRKK